MQRFLLYKKYHRPEHIFTIWEFTYRLLPLYLWTHVWGENSANYPMQPKKDSNLDEQDYLKYDS